MPRLCLAVCLLLAACVDVPEIGDRIPPESRDAAYPSLIPLDGLEPGPADPAAEAEEAERQLAARAAALKARAARLGQGPVIDPATEDRMRAGVPQG